MSGEYNGLYPTPTRLNLLADISVTVDSVEIYFEANQCMGRHSAVQGTNRADRPDASAPAGSSNEKTTPSRRSGTTGTRVGSTEGVMTGDYKRDDCSPSRSSLY
jgi:hypothetical protein